MVSLLLDERTPPNGRVLVLGAGGGLELKALADAHAGWSFDGVDPSRDMLELATETVGLHRSRVRFHEGDIGVAPDGPFDAATSLLTFHFIPRSDRLNTLRQVRSRLRTGAPLVIAHISFPQNEPDRSIWINRHAAYGAPDGADAALLQRTQAAMRTRLTILSPEEEAEMLWQAGFDDVSLFYAGLSFKGWVAYAQ